MRKVGAKKRASLTVAQLRRAIKLMKEAIGPPPEYIQLLMRDDIRLTVSGAVWIPGIGYYHPKTFIDLVGQETYDYLLTLPRVVSEYDIAFN